ncbi:MAG TPA: XRE family transcriptional regulator [Armatimonadetes bacterium]|nr:XRE family transcriptional regulator [Armatimonadota bacterium]
MSEIGRRIKQAREEKGLTQSQLAAVVHCSPQAISNWEIGNRTPSYEDLQRLAEALGRPRSWFLGEEMPLLPLQSAWQEVEQMRARLDYLSALLRQTTQAFLPPVTVGVSDEEEERILLQWVLDTEQDMPSLVKQVERGEIRWATLIALCDELIRAAVRLRPRYHNQVLRPAALALRQIARALGDQGYRREAIEAGEQAAKLFDELDDPSCRQDALLNLYNLALFYLGQGELEKAREYGEVAASAEDWTVLWRAWGLLAELEYNFALQPDDWELTYCQRMLTLADAHEEDDPEQAARARCLAYEIQGNFYFTHGQYAAALEAARQELQESRKSPQHRVANAHLDVAQYALALGNTEEAFAHLAQATKIIQALDAKALKARAHAHYAEAYRLIGQVEQSRIEAHQGLQVAWECEALWPMILCEMAYAAACTASEQWAEALFHAREALNVARRMGLQPYQQRIRGLIEEIQTQSLQAARHQEQPPAVRPRLRAV